MQQTIQLKTIVPLIRNSVSHSPIRRGLLLIALAFGCFALSPAARAVLPAPDGGYPNGNTAEGDFALQSLTTGTFNTGLGIGALFSNTDGLQNTATGAGALFKNTGNDNTANGAGALFNNTLGIRNTAHGLGALFSNTVANNNTAVGWEALASNTTGSANTAIGTAALQSNTSGGSNTANGIAALASNTIGHDNTANGLGALGNNGGGSDNVATGNSALVSNTNGDWNTADGVDALFNTMGSFNTALGFNAGDNLTTGDYNIDIGNEGVAGEANTLRIGTAGNQTATFIAGINGVNQGLGTAVFINTTTGQLGTAAPSSSRRFKKEIKPMDQTSEAVLGLKPVTFQYKSDSKNTPQFGLIAEEVAQVNPDLIVRDEKGEIYTVRYDAVNAMLLNEFLKEHRKVEQLKSTVAKQEAIIAKHQKGMEALAVHLKEQDSKIQKVTDRLEVNKPAPQMVLNR